MPHKRSSNLEHVMEFTNCLDEHWTLQWYLRLYKQPTCSCSSPERIWAIWSSKALSLKSKTLQTHLMVKYCSAVFTHISGLPSCTLYLKLKQDLATACTSCVLTTPRTWTCACGVREPDYTLMPGFQMVLNDYVCRPKDIIFWGTLEYLPENVKVSKENLVLGSKLWLAALHLKMLEFAHILKRLGQYFDLLQILFICICTKMAFTTFSDT